MSHQFLSLKTQGTKTMNNEKKDIVGMAIKVVETDTIKAYYAKLPTLDLGHRYLVEILEPVPMVPCEKRTYKNRTTIDIGYEPISSLEELLLKEWKDGFKDSEEIHKDHWVFKIDKVELIECDLLIPKEK